MEKEEKVVFIIYDNNKAEEFNECLKQHGFKEEFCPQDIKKYLELIKILFGENMAIKYNSTDNAIEVIIEANLSEHEELIEICKTLNNTYRKKPLFKNISHMEKDGTTIENKEKEMADKKELNSYLYQSLFYEGLSYPEGSNISPKTDDETNIEVTGFKSSLRSYSLRNFNITSDVDNELCKLITGKFVSDVEKKYDYYWDANLKKQTNMRKRETFIMIDNGDFETKITVESQTNVTVDTTIKVIRNVVGYNYDGITIRDGYFGNNTHKDSSFDIRIIEYFNMIKPNIMLHYSDNSDFIELYSLPKGWNVTDGLDKLERPKVYDDTNTGDLKMDEDYALIKDIMNAKIEKGNSRVLTSKK